MNDPKPEFRRLHEEHLDSVYRYCLRLCGNRSDAEDITQDTFVAAFRALDGYRAEANPRTWLFAIAHRTAVKHLRRKRLLAVFAEPKGVDHDIVGRVALEEQIQKLPLKQRECLLLVKVEGFSCEEAAEIVSAPVGTVKHRIHAGMKLLRQRMLLGDVPTGEINYEK